MGLTRIFCLLLLLIVLAGCSRTAPYRIERTGELQRPEGDTILYFVPFQTALVPEEIANDLFNQMVDDFDGAAAGSGLTALILKPELTTVDSNWLTQQYYVTGDVYAYAQDSGCCSTEIKLQTRIHLYQPNTPAPVMQVELPYRILFDHDRSNLEAEQNRMAATLAEQLRSAILAEVAPL